MALGLNGVKLIEELQQNWKNTIEEVTYYQTNMDWLQSRFPEAKYADVVGLCKLADKTVYAEEQDYSMNASRYVGIEMEQLSMNHSEFKNHILKLNEKLIDLNKKAVSIENTISSNLKELVQ
jgi:type I restriction enzyme M protein